jgi:hypothetical protein
MSRRPARVTARVAAGRTSDRPVTRAVALAVLAGATVLATASPASAHGVGGRRDLPVPLWQFLYASAFALVVSFLLLRISWTTPRFARAATGRPAGAATDRVLRVARGLVRALGLVVFAVTVSAAWVGDTTSTNNIAPVMVYVALWVGVQVLSAVFGDVWSALSPYDTIGLAIDRLRGRPDATGTAAPAAGTDSSILWSHWPAALGVLGFVWLELCYYDNGNPRRLALFMTVYSVAVLAMVARHGRRWLRTGEAFAALFGLLAAMAPFTRDDTGRLRVRLPFAGLAQVQARRGTVALVVIMLGGTAFDGVQRTQWWSDVQGTAVGWDRTFLATTGLSWTIVVVAVAYVLAANLAGRIGGLSPNDAPRRYVASLVPIVFGYTVAHYFTYLIVEGQALIALVSNPYGRNWNLFGTVDHVVNLAPVGPRAVSWVQVVAIVAGHVAGVVAAHDRAVEAHPHALATRTQIPMLVVMIGFTLSGLVLLLNG